VAERPTCWARRSNPPRKITRVKSEKKPGSVGSGLVLPELRRTKTWVVWR
jgi:hypothetical protein